MRAEVTNALLLLSVCLYLKKDEISVPLGVFPCVQVQRAASRVPCPPRAQPAVGGSSPFLL